LANHYEAFAPYSKVVAATYADIVLVPWVLRDCPICGDTLNVDPLDCPQCTLELSPELTSPISRVVVQRPEDGNLGILMSTGRFQPLRVPLTPALEISLAADLSWVDQAEPTATFGWAATAPAAVGLAPDGSDVVERVYVAHGRLLSERDIGRRPPRDAFAQSAALAPRIGSIAVYSRAEGRVFLLGGSDSTGQAVSELWTRSLDSEAWEIIAPRGETPGKVFAASYDASKRELWVLDQVAGKHPHLIRRRLLTMNPGTGETRVLATWPSLGLFDQYFLRIDRDGSLLLFASSTQTRKHVVMRLSRTSSGVALKGAGFRLGKLEAAPVVDEAGYWLFVRKLKNKPVRAERLDDLGLKQVPWIAVSNCF
jgi:hypothetical protein